MPINPNGLISLKSGKLAVQTLFSQPRCYKYVAMIQGAFLGWGAITTPSGEPPQRGWFCGMCFIILIHSRNCTEGHQKKMRLFYKNNVGCNVLAWCSSHSVRPQRMTFCAICHATSPTSQCTHDLHWQTVVHQAKHVPT